MPLKLRKTLCCRRCRRLNASVLINKYAEGYAGYELTYVVEELTISRVKRLFKCRLANVRSPSDSRMNQAVAASSTCRQVIRSWD
ncbi:MAG: hypothetical protein ACKESB_00165 [Candidatus Hodgkinia cicadicola]